VGVNVKRVAGGAMVVLGMLVPAAPIAHAGGHGDKTQTLRIVAVEIQSEFLDLGTPGPSLGDELVFSETLFKKKREVGTSGVVCTVVQAIAPYDVLTFHCVGTLSLRGGQITLQGLIEVQGEDDPGPFLVAITGGTGKYRGAGGEAKVRDVGDVTIYKLLLDKGKKDDRHKHHHHHR
jgi:hypothetical protein